MTLEELGKFKAAAREAGVTVESVDPYDGWVTATTGEMTLTMPPLVWDAVRPASR